MSNGPALDDPPPGTRQTRRRLYEILEPASPGDRTSHVLDLALAGLIIANIVMLVLETVQPVRASAWLFFLWFERLSIALFTVEYLLRLWCAPADVRYADPVRGRLRWASTPLALADLLAIVPFFLPFLGADLRAARALRIFRLAKLGRYSDALQTMGRIVRKKKEELLTMLMLLALLLLITSSLLYFAERDAQTPGFGSIPEAAWWAVVTLTTVGYGDVFPVTPTGRLLAGISAILGIAMLALPTGILGAAFVEETQRRGAALVCPHCGGAVGGAASPPPGSGGQRTDGGRDDRMEDAVRQ